MSSDPRPLPDALAAVRAARALSNPAFITVSTDEAVSAALDAAPDGPLHAVPFAVKDNIDVVGMPTTAAYPALSTPRRTSATAVQRLIEAGAIPIGKTNLDQFATGLVGTRSPYGACHCVSSVAHVSGGSSSGSAVAVAAGVVPFALGTDTAGSGRVPAAFNGLIGFKPTRGLVSTRGVFPACPSLDCVSILSRTMAMARTVLGVLASFDAASEWSRPRPTPLPAGVAASMSVVGVPAGVLDLDTEHGVAWRTALAYVGDRVRIQPVDVAPLLEAAQLLYGGPFLAERLVAFGALLGTPDPDLDPVVRQIVLGARGMQASDLFTAQHRLRQLALATEELFAGLDAIMLPTTPGHPRLVEVAADPVAVNARLGTYTNMANLLDLCAVALPMAPRPDGLPFGVQLLAPAWADGPLIELAARLLREPGVDVPTPADDHCLLAVCGAHLSGQPLNSILRRAGAVLQTRGRTAPGYRMVRIEGVPPRPGLLDDGTGPAGGIDIELWDAPLNLVRQLEVDTEAPLRIGRVRLADGSMVAGFTAEAGAVSDAPDISAARGWRAHLAAH
jgi:allophanate hydrolase